MYYLSEYSENKLSTCAEPLQRIAHATIQAVDFKVICGHRGEIAQNEAYNTGHSDKKWPDGKHNVSPSLAIDIVPWHSKFPNIRWEDTDSFIYLAGHILMSAHLLGISLRWGRDWNMNDNLNDEHFFDWGHFELTGSPYDSKKG